MRRVATALIHYPILDRDRAIVTTAITNLDLHDIARSAHTFGLSDYFVVHPIAAQRELAERVRTHWVDGSGGRRIPDRRAPLEQIRVVNTLSDAVDALGGRDSVEIWTTSAQPSGRTLLHFADARERLRTEGPTVLILFGTGWGLADEVHAQAEYQLAPIDSPRHDRYNHLSVRAAAAITFDRILGDR
jgi:hypothetical protein